VSHTASSGESPKTSIPDLVKRERRKVNIDRQPRGMKTARSAGWINLRNQFQDMPIGMRDDTVDAAISQGAKVL
jgi:hypothetical protein